MREKKGQELSITALILIVIGVAVAVVIILGFWKGWGYIIGSTDLLPGDIAKKSTFCDSYVTVDSKPSYCEFSSPKTNNWLNCEDTRLTLKVKMEPGCNPTDKPGEKENAKCTELSSEKGYDATKVIVNNEKCSVRLKIPLTTEQKMAAAQTACNKYSGTLVGKSNGCTSVEKKEAQITDEKDKAAINAAEQVCCIVK